MSDWVYLVTSGCYSSYSIEAAFSTEENAQEYLDSRATNPHVYGNAHIEPIPLDRWQQFKDRQVWHVTIYDDAVDIKTASRLNGHTTVNRLEPDLTSEDELALGINRGENTIWFYHDGPQAGNWSGGWVTGPESMRNPVTQSYWNANVIADSEEHAIKVAAELIAQEKARLAGM